MLFVKQQQACLLFYFVIFLAFQFTSFTGAVRTCKYFPYHEADGDNKTEALIECPAYCCNDRCPTNFQSACCTYSQAGYNDDDNYCGQYWASFLLWMLSWILCCCCCCCIPGAIISTIVKKKNARNNKGQVIAPPPGAQAGVSSLSYPSSTAGVGGGGGVSSNYAFNPTIKYPRQQNPESVLISDTNPGPNASSLNYFPPLPAPPSYDQVLYQHGQDGPAATINASSAASASIAMASADTTNNDRQEATIDVKPPPSHQ